MRTVSYLLILISALCLILSNGCAAKPQQDISYYEATGVPAQRIANITAMLMKFHAPPTPMTDAQFVEEKFGNGELGPADFHTFFMIQVAPENLAKWQELLTPLGSAPEYQAPGQVYDWWISKDDFAKAQFFAPDELAGRSNGWIAIVPENGKIYIYTFTT